MEEDMYEQTVIFQVGWDFNIQFWKDSIQF